MKDLSSKYDIPLVPSSMNPGNTTYDEPQLAMTAPGSQSVLPRLKPNKMDVLPMPQASDGETPVSDAPKKPHPSKDRHPGGPRTFGHQGFPGTWKGTDFYA